MNASGLRLPPLGAPGLYWLPPNPIRALTGERMDVCAFVGVAPRGPSRIPVLGAPWAPRPCAEGATGTRSVAVPVESWSEYARLYGKFEGPGLLPYAVAYKHLGMQGFYGVLAFVGILALGLLYIIKRRALEWD